MVKLITFDVYGTLVDWRATLGSFVGYIAGVNYVEDFFKCDLESVSGLTGYKPYSEILVECLKRVCVKAGRQWSEWYGEAVALAFAKSPPFPDTILGLRALKSMGLRVAVISNTERRLIKITLAGLEHLVDEIVTAEDTGFYKPHREAFTRAYKLLGVDPSEALHVSSYPQYDLETARALGVKAVHLNRYGYKWEPSINSLEELPAIVRSIESP